MCGGVRFEVTEAPAHAGYCHCRRCQRRTGTAASISARIAPGSLRILEGEELIKAYEPEEMYGLICKAIQNDERIELPLDRLDVADDSPNRQLLEDYRFWVRNWG